MLYCELSPINQYDKDASYLVNYWGTEAHLESLYTGYISVYMYMYMINADRENVHVYPRRGGVKE